MYCISNKNHDKTFFGILSSSILSQFESNSRLAMYYVSNDDNHVILPKFNTHLEHFFPIFDKFQFFCRNSLKYPDAHWYAAFEPIKIQPKKHVFKPTFLCMCVGFFVCLLSSEFHSSFQR